MQIQFTFERTKRVSFLEEREREEKARKIEDGAECWCCLWVRMKGGN
jgi:hypothetical protein